MRSVLLTVSDHGCIFHQAGSTSDRRPLSIVLCCVFQFCEALVCLLGTLEAYSVCASRKCSVCVSRVSRPTCRVSCVLCCVFQCRMPYVEYLILCVVGRACVCADRRVGACRWGVVGRVRMRWVYPCCGQTQLFFAIVICNRNDVVCFSIACRVSRIVSCVSSAVCVYV